MQTLEVSITRWGDRWLVEVPTLHAFTVVPHLRDAAAAAQRCGATALGALPELVAVAITRVDFEPHDHSAATQLTEVITAAARASKEARAAAAANTSAAILLQHRHRSIA